jgi:hypothetical protein
MMVRQSRSFVFNFAGRRMQREAISRFMLRRVFESWVLFESEILNMLEPALDGLRTILIITMALEKQTLPEMV